MRRFYFYNPTMWRQHLYRYIAPENLTFHLEDFGSVGKYKNQNIFRAMKNIMLFEPSSGKSFLLKSKDSRNYFFIEEEPQYSKLPSCYEGEVVGSVYYNDQYNYDEHLLYNCRVCLQYDIYISDECSHLVETERSELVSYTRQHYHQLIKYFNLPPLNFLLNNENKNEVVFKTWKSYFK